MSTFGNKIKLSVFGESHGEGIGVVIDGAPAGYAIDTDRILQQMARRAPGRDKTATPRVEKDFPEIMSGLLGGVTTGAPICCVIKNTNTRSGDYSDLISLPRPGHSDYTAFVKYKGRNDIRGGGHFSGRLTAPLVFAGAILRQILQQQGIKIAAHIASIGDVEDERFDPVDIDPQLMERLSLSGFALIDESKEEAMRAVVTAAAKELDSVGGTIECAVTGLPAGAGGPLFEGIEGQIAQAMFAIPAVKGVEFGRGFESSRLRGSQNNDPFEYKNGRVLTKTNNCGGILGGISNGMPLIFRIAVKPTPSIAKEQDTVNLQRQENDKLKIKGRHDPCIVPRAVPVAEAMTAAAIIDLL